jgi:hypothetical protein
MNYVLVKWIHSFPSEPVLLYSEIDENRWEVRKVEVYADGHCGYASSEGGFSGSILGQVQFPPVAEIAEDKQFEPCELSQEEFEHIWAHRKRPNYRAERTVDIEEKR